MVCPNCNLSYPETVTRCGCGYDFLTRRVEITEPKPSNLWLKLTAIFAAGMLLGWGLCGIIDSQTAPGGRFQYLGLYEVGTFIFFASFVGFVVSLLGVLINKMNASK